MCLNHLWIWGTGLDPKIRWAILRIYHSINRLNSTQFNEHLWTQVHRDICFGRYRYRGPGDTFWYHDTTEYRDTDDDTCHELNKRVCSEIITVAPTQVHKQYQFAHSVTHHNVSLSHSCILASFFSSSIATVDTAQKLDVIVDCHLTMSTVDACQLRVSVSILLPAPAIRQVVWSVSVDAAKTSSPCVHLVDGV